MTRAETIHLTLAFLGDVAQERLDELKALAIHGRRHELPIEQAGYWPHNRIVWAGPGEMPASLERLASDLSRALSAMGFKTENREFAAHVTLIRKARAVTPLPPLPRVRWPVEEVVLVESRRAGAGRSYAVRQRYALT